MIKKIFILLIPLLLVNAQKFIKEIISSQPEDVCLNGQSSFAYFAQTQPSIKTNILVYFMSTPSSSFCGGTSLPSTLQNCINLQQQMTSFWTSSMNINSGILADFDSKQWFKVIIPHCDGGLYQGYSKQSTKYKTKDLYFRGNSIIKATFNKITQKIKGFTSYNIIFSGSGIGAIGAMIWSRYYKDSITFSVQKFKLVLDSIPRNQLSFKANSNIYQQSLQNMMKLANIDQPHPFSLCALRYQGQEQQCFFIDQGYMYYNFPIMIVESQYDSFTLKNVMEIDCVSQNGSLSTCSSEQIKYIQNQRSHRIVKLIQIANFNDNSFWSIACSSSNFLIKNYNSPSYSIRGVQAGESIKKFIDFDDIHLYQRPVIYDYYSWPSNQQCSGQ